MYINFVTKTLRNFRYWFMNTQAIGFTRVTDDEVPTISDHYLKMTVNSLSLKTICKLTNQ